MTSSSRFVMCAAALAVAVVLAGAGVAVFEKAALDAVRQWRYVPSELNGQPVEVLLVTTINFKLSATDKPQPTITFRLHQR